MATGPSLSLNRGEGSGAQALALVRSMALVFKLALVGAEQLQRMLVDPSLGRKQGGGVNWNVLRMLLRNVLRQEGRKVDRMSVRILLRML